MNKITQPHLLLHLLQKGDMVAYETVFRLYYDKLLHIAKGYLGSTEDAEDIVQNVFIKIWKKRRNFDKIDSLNNYLFTMTKNACLDFLKHQKVKKSFSKNYYEEKLSLQHQFIKDESASSLLVNELEKGILIAIESLPEKCKKVFIKSRIEGMKHSEIAEILNISKKTVNNHISNALRDLRLNLKEFLPFF